MGDYVKGDLVLVPVVLQAKNPEELAKLVVAERIKKNQLQAAAHYTVLHVHGRYEGRTSGHTTYTAFVEFLVEEK